MKKNEAQEKAIHTINGQLIIVACPGSGKTTTLIRRIHHMITECKISSEHILMITFSNAAAREMRERYHKTYGVDGVTFSTIHSMCFAILRKFGGYKNENILTDQRSFFYEKLRYNKKINDKEEFINSLLTELSVIKNNQIPLEGYQPKCCNDKKFFTDLLNAYEKYKSDLSLVDFDDMLIKAYQIMQEDPDCLAWLRNQYQYIQVDEYQDVNYIQRDIVYLLAGENGNLAVVGDDDQSIYGFRGAQPQIMLDFKKTYPNAVEVHMGTNYRSCKEIIKSSGKLISKNKNRFEKKFVGEKKGMGKITMLMTKDRMEEITKISQMIKKEVLKGNTDIAVLYRTNHQAEAVANAFLNAGIEFHCNDKINNRYEHWMFEDIQAFYNLANNKSKYPQRDIARVLNHPNRFLFDTAYFKAGLDKQKMRRAAFKNTSDSWKCQKALDGIEDFFFILDRLAGLTPYEFLLRLERVGYLTYLQEYADFRNVEKSELMDIWDQYKADAKENNDWNKWGHYIVRYKKAIEKSSHCKEGVTLSTMHSAKGLEWGTVYVIDCVENICPYNKKGVDTDLEEERRLFYVAMTRAKENLYLCTYKTKNGKRINVSPYLRDAS